VLLGKQFWTFRRTVLPPPSGSSCPRTVWPWRRTHRALWNVGTTCRFSNLASKDEMNMNIDLKMTSKNAAAAYCESQCKHLLCRGRLRAQNTKLSVTAVDVAIRNLQVMTGVRRPRHTYAIFSVRLVSRKPPSFRFAVHSPTYVRTTIRKTLWTPTSTSEFDPRPIERSYMVLFIDMVYMCVLWILQLCTEELSKL